MEHRDLIELLAAQGDQPEPNVTGIAGTRSSDLSPQQQQELGVLLQLAEQVKEALAPVSPSPSFKGKLRLDLTHMAHRQVSYDVVVAPLSPPKELLIGAAIGSAMALAGGIAYLIRVRTQARS